MKIQVGDKNYSLPGGGVRGVILLIIFIIVLASGLYSVDADEVGMITRLGKFVRQVPPGLHMKIPFGIESVRNVKIKKVFKEEFGFRTVQPGVRTQYSTRSYQDESLMLTGDLNVADVEWIVQFRIKDPYEYLFKISDVRKSLRDISEAITRKVIGDRTVTGVLTRERVEIAKEVRKGLQETLDSYEAGIHIVTVKFKDVNPPEPVKPAFNEVNSAKQDKSKMINKAWEEYNNEIPKAKGEAEQMISEAEGYALNRVNRARGDVALFNEVYGEYRKSPDATRRRLYLETMNKILPRLKDIYIVDEKQKSILPLLQLEKSLKGGGQ
ncbi:MAG: FtsH protease activity modulator HflK [Candidatus Krumholzibacteriales bacterium]